MREKIIENCTLIQGDCLEVMNKFIEDGLKVDLILTDPPFETSACKWDKHIPFIPMWECLKELIKKNRAIVLMGTEPFTSKLINSNLDMWKYNWTWKKESGTNFLNSKYQPMKVTEDICVFGEGATSWVKSGENLIYNPQMTYGAKPYKAYSGLQKPNSAVARDKNFMYRKKGSDGSRYPTNVLEFIRDKDKVHPTQKPVALMEYLIRTYSNEGDLVLDFTAGSFTTGVACVNTNRKFIGIDISEEYVNIGISRIEGAYNGKK